LDDSRVNVIIDVIRAFTVAHYAFIRGAKGILLAGTVDEAFRLKERNPSFLLAGEVGGLPIPGFELDNSPSRLQRVDLREKVLIQKTTNGVAATLNALNAEHVFVTGFSNARTTAEYIKRKFMNGDDANMHVIASHPTGDDDLACAQYIAGILEGACQRDLSAERIMERIRNSEAAGKFYDNGMPEFLRDDMDFCIREVPSDFVMKVNGAQGVPMIEKIPVTA